LQKQTADYIVPELGEGITEVDIANLHVEVGDVITSGTIVAEVETEKAVMDLECHIAGTITAIHASSGDTLQVGSPLLTLALN
jgi:2-oxoisovalerate dehydrogenase E2 component (dihydrolipoyl transacylase)